MEAKKDHIIYQAYFQSSDKHLFKHKKVSMW